MNARSSPEFSEFEVAACSSLDHGSATHTRKAHHTRTYTHTSPAHTMSITPIVFASRPAPHLPSLAQRSSRRTKQPPKLFARGVKTPTLPTNGASLLTVMSFGSRLRPSELSRLFAALTCCVYRKSGQPHQISSAYLWEHQETEVGFGTGKCRAKRPFSARGCRL